MDREFISIHTAAIKLENDYDVDSEAENETDTLEVVGKTEKLWWEIEDDIENDQFSEFFSRFGSSNRCRLCPFMAPDSSLFGKHIKEDHPECERYQCKFCVKEFFHVYKCMNHIENNHTEELNSEKEKCKYQRRHGSPTIFPYRNCYTVIPSCADFKYVKANMNLLSSSLSDGEESSDEEDELLSVTESENNDPDIEIIDHEKAEPITVDLTLDGGDLQEPEHSQNEANAIHGNYEIVDEDGNVFILNSEEDSEQSGSGTEHDIFRIPPPVYDVDDDDDLSNLSAPASEPPAASLASNSFLQFHYQPEETHIKLPPKKQTLKIPKKKVATPVEPVNGGFLKPMFSYSQLIYLAFKNSVEGYLFVSQVYLFIMDHFPYYRTAPSSWKNSIRHTLCGSKCFLKGPNSATVPGDTSLRKNMYWTLSPDQNAIIKMETEIDKVISRNFPNVSLAMPNPENLVPLQQGQLKKQYSRFGSSLDNVDGETEEPIRLAMPESDFDSTEGGSVQVQVMDASDIVPTTSYATATSLQSLSAESIGADSHRSSHFRLVDNGVGLELQPMDVGEACMFYVYD